LAAALPTSALFTKNYKIANIGLMEDAKKDLYWFFFIILILVIAWYLRGGPETPGSKSGLFLNNPQQTHTQEVRRGLGGVVPESEENNGAGTGGQVPATGIQNTPFFNNPNFRVNLNIGGARESDPKKEYIEISVFSNSDQPVNITGWSLVGKSGVEVKIGQGAYLPYSAQVNPQQDIYLKNGERAIVVTGSSPIGTSFRLNKCTGYFSQFQVFYPGLYQDCPRPDDEDIPLSFNDKCITYLEGLPRCRIQISIPAGLQPECQNFVNENINYSGCVNNHKDDSDFYKPEWRIYLNRSSELWSNKRETIILQDQNKRLIDWVYY
jgi:hypothetical protein